MQIANSFGLESGLEWKSFPDRPHLQLKNADEIRKKIKQSFDKTIHGSADPIEKEKQIAILFGVLALILSLI